MPFNLTREALSTVCTKCGRINRLTLLDAAVAEDEVAGEVLPHYCICSSKHTEHIVTETTIQLGGA